jgi:hypothetical protein
MYNKLNYLAVIFTIALFSSCEKKDPVIPNDEELITTVQIYKRYEVLADSLLASFRDLDGAGGNDPDFIDPVFNANSNYQLKLVFLNETTDPADNISAEIAEEAADHQLFFIADSNLEITSAYYDQDENGNPVGLFINVETGAASSGEWKVILRHLPDKFAGGVSDGLVDNAGGETDIEIIFDATVQ